MSTVLVAVSSVTASQKMLNPVLTLSRRLGGTVLVTHIATPRVGEPEDELRRRGYESVAELKEQLMEGGVATDAKVVFASNPATAIVDLAIEQGVTMIILGITGKGGFARMLAGNIPMEIIKQSTVPVLLIPPDWDGKL